MPLAESCSTAGTSTRCTATTCAAQVLGLVGNHLKPGQLYDDRERVSDGAIRRLARKCEPALLYRVARADCLGRTGDFPPVAMEWFLERVQRARGGGAPAAADPEGPARGGMGVPPGPEVGRIVQAVYERQLDGAVTDLEQAEAEARRMIATTNADEPTEARRHGERRKRGMTAARGAREAER